MNYRKRIVDEQLNFKLEALELRLSKGQRDVVKLQQLNRKQKCS